MMMVKNAFVHTVLYNYRLLFYPAFLLLLHMLVCVLKKFFSMYCYFTLWDQYFLFCKNTVIMPKYGNVAWIFRMIGVMAKTLYGY